VRSDAAPVGLNNQPSPLSAFSSTIVAYGPSIVTSLLGNRPGPSGTALSVSIVPPTPPAPPPPVPATTPPTPPVPAPPAPPNTTAANLRAFMSDLHACHPVPSWHGASNENLSRTLLKAGMPALERACYDEPRDEAHRALDSVCILARSGLRAERLACAGRPPNRRERRGRQRDRAARVVLA
jgi:hypothetical protein